MNENTSQRTDETIDSKTDEQIQLLIDRLGKNTISRRTFLKATLLFGGLATGFYFDEKFTQGMFKDFLKNFLTNEKYRDKVITKIKQGGLVEEFKQMLNDATYEEQLLTLSETNLTNDILASYSIEHQIFNTENNKVILMNVKQVEIKTLTSEEQGGVVLYQRGKMTEGIYLPGFQIGSDVLSNAYMPHTATAVEGYLEVNTKINDYGGAVVVNSQGELKVMNMEELRAKYCVSNSSNFTCGQDLEPAKLIYSAPFCISIDLGEQDQDLLLQVQFAQIDNDDFLTLATKNLSSSPRYETFYVCMDDEAFLFSIYATSDDDVWDKNNRLTMKQAAALMIEMAIKKGKKKIRIIPTDPDINDAVHHVPSSGVIEHSGLFSQEEAKTFFTKPFYLVISPDN